MFGMSMTEMIIIVVFALLILGPKELPNVAKTIGKTLRDVRQAGDDLRETFEREIMQDKPAPKPQPVAEAVAKESPALPPSEAPAAPSETAPAAPAVSETAATGTDTTKV